MFPAILVICTRWVQHHLRALSCWLFTLAHCSPIEYTTILPHCFTPVLTVAAPHTTRNNAFTTTSLIAPSGKLWKTGYDNGELKTPLFADVIPTLEAWKQAGKVLAIFSSGSVQAQLQFFSVVEHGQTTRDLKPLFTAHFDPTLAGSKLERASYEKICAELGCEVNEVLFLTDNVLGMWMVTLLHAMMWCVVRYRIRG